MIPIPTYRDLVMNGLDLDDLLDKAKDAASAAQGQAEKEIGDASVKLPSGLSSEVERIATGAAEAHAEQLVSSGTREVKTTWDKAKPWVIGGGIFLGGILIVIAVRAGRK